MNAAKTAADLHKIANMIQKTGSTLTVTNQNGMTRARVANNYSITLAGYGKTTTEALAELAGKIASVYAADFGIPVTA